MSRIPKYPVVFVHGMFGWGDDEGINNYLPYWGATTGNLTTYLNEQGYDTYSASVGPASSAWDRACELYARLMGGVVDYGKVHSSKTNHRRYGRYYEAPLFEGWSPEKKIHLIGHSFGGNTVRMLAHLLTYGSQEERDGTDESENISELFMGGHEDLISGLVAICAPHNGTTTFLVAEKFKILPVMKAVAYNYIGIAGRSPAEGTIFDFHLEQYGLSDTPGKKDAFPIRRAKKQFKNNLDNVEYDMCPDGAKKLNEFMEISKNIYYFSYPYSCVTINTLGTHAIATKADFRFLEFTSYLVLLYHHMFEKKKNLSFEDKSTDGLVDLKSAQHPDDEPFKYFDRNDIKPGIWNVMPTRVGDHGTPIGLFADGEVTREFYIDMLDLLASIE